MVYLVSGHARGYLSHVYGLLYFLHLPVLFFGQELDDATLIYME